MWLAKRQDKKMKKKKTSLIFDKHNRTSKDKKNFYSNLYDFGDF